MTVAQLTPSVVFLVGVAALLTLDIGVLSRRNETMTTRSAMPSEPNTIMKTNRLSMLSDSSMR